MRALGFYYGSYMDPEVLRRFGANPLEPRPALLRNWHLTFTPHANLIPRAGSLVHGIVYDLPHDELERLYGPNGFVTTYKPVAVNVEVGENVLPALTFIEPAAAAPPPGDYLDAFLGICNRMGLPETYMASIRDEAMNLA